ncbi:carboxylate-amine ligase [Actinokineospora iranica]|uniref:Putative glutamate--cysteine ligase 2 n=1 Tax=Actinokineospora iranica TaxID=1271860 RepID=A0A1G6S7F9_9PSEU|nr:glutamate--cysteine ligase [Actinokineospora iranica]SDD12634.1 carboxylate-amine ligase [Actinokineospora iranica]
MPAAGGATDQLTFGVEEEFLLVDADTLLPAPRARAVLDRTAASSAGHDSGFHHELCASVVEAASAVCATLPELGARIRSGRAALAASARRENARLVSVGEPVLTAAEPEITATDHFHRMRESYAGVVTDQELCGCHVHVGVPDRDTGVAVLNHITPWLPTLLALTANSRYRHGADSGFHSWRMMVHTRLPAATMPPWHASAAAYDADLARLVDCGMVEPGQGSLRVARLSRRYPTVEIRIGDAAATVAEAVLYAALARALVRRALDDLAVGRTAGPLDHGVLDCALWAAARHGLHGAAVDPWRERETRAIDLLDALLAHVRDALDDLGDAAAVTALAAAARGRGCAATRQRAAAATGGAPAVVRMLGAETVAGVRVPDPPGLVDSVRRGGGR